MVQVEDVPERFFTMVLHRFPLLVMPDAHFQVGRGMPRVLDQLPFLPYRLRRIVSLDQRPALRLAGLVELQGCLGEGPMVLVGDELLDRLAEQGRSGRAQRKGSEQYGY